LPAFKSQLKATGADFPDSFVENLDRLILSMHPKHKKRHSANASNGTGASSGQKGVLDEQDKKRRLFPGLSLPDREIQPSAEKDVFMKSVDDMMADLEGMAKKKKAVEPTNNESERASKRQRRSRSRSPRRGRSPSPPRGRRGDRGFGDNQHGRGRPQLDERPVLYKIYNGKVSSLKDFGAFITLEGVVGRVEGTYERIHV